MKKFLIILFLSFLSGCAFLEKIAPSGVDELGAPVPGTHAVIQPVKSVTDAIPYGEAAVGIMLLVWNFIEKAKANKNQKGLMATVRAIEQAGKDPDIKEAVKKIKTILSNAHDIAEVQPLLRELLKRV